MAAVAPVRPPKEIPAELKEKVDTLHNSVQVLFVSKQIPWIIQSQMAEDGYVTMEDLACRWVSAEKAREEGPKDSNGENGFDKSNSDFSAMRLYQAVVQARSLLHSGKASSLSDVMTRPSTGFNLDALCDRVALEKDWVNQTGQPKPRLEYQGSDHHLRSSHSCGLRGMPGGKSTSSWQTVAPWRLQWRPSRKTGPGRSMSGCSSSSWRHQEILKAKERVRTRGRKEARLRASTKTTWRPPPARVMARVTRPPNGVVPMDGLRIRHCRQRMGSNIAGISISNIPAKRTVPDPMLAQWGSMDGRATETTPLTNVQVRGKLEPSWTPDLLAGMIQRVGKRAPRMTSHSELRLMGQETWRTTLCQRPNHSFPIQPCGRHLRVRNPPILQKSRGLTKTPGGRVSYGSPSGHFTTANTFSMDRLSPRAAQTRAPLGPISITIWGASYCFFTGKADSQSHEKHERAPGMNSSDLSRYPPEMMQGLSTAIIQHIAIVGSGPALEVRAHSLQLTGEVPVCEVVDRPSTTPVSRLQALLDPTVMVRLGFKVRPLRDGGGKPSPGRSPPPLRKPAPSLVDLGKKILGLATSVVDKVLGSIHRQDKHHPFPPALLAQVRSLVPGSHQDTPSDRQPFSWITFGEWQRWPMIQTPNTLRSWKMGCHWEWENHPSRVWPTKEELKGESL